MPNYIHMLTIYSFPKGISKISHICANTNWILLLKFNDKWTINSYLLDTGFWTGMMWLSYRGQWAIWEYCNWLMSHLWGIPILPTPISSTPVLPTLKFYLIPVSPTVDFCACFWCSYGKTCNDLHICITVSYDVNYSTCFWWKLALHDFEIGVSILITFKISDVKSCFFPLK